MIADRLLIIRHVPCHRDLSLPELGPLVAGPGRSLSPSPVIDAHERYAFRAEELHKSDSHPFGRSQYCVLLNFKRNLSLFLAPSLEPQGLPDAAFYCI